MIEEVANGVEDVKGSLLARASVRFRGIEDSGLVICE
jgi:hypothetical protein